MKEKALDTLTPSKPVPGQGCTYTCVNVGTAFDIWLGEHAENAE